jgi:sugar phosphate isomerase/epimerase
VLDQHFPIGRGTIDYGDVFTQLRQIGFTGTGTLEVSFPDAVIESLHQLTVAFDS